MRKEAERQRYSETETETGEGKKGGKNQAMWKRVLLVAGVILLLNRENEMASVIYIVKLFHECLG